MLIDRSACVSGLMRMWLECRGRSSRTSHRWRAESYWLTHFSAPHSLCTWQILSSTPSYKHDTVLLQVVTLSWNVGDDSSSSAQLHFCYFAHGRVWLLRFDGVHFGAHSFLLIRSLQGRSFRLTSDGFACTTSDLVQSSLQRCSRG